MALINGGLYIMLRCQSDVGSCSWSLYLHEGTFPEVVQTRSPRGRPVQSVVHIPRGRRYQITVIDCLWMPNHHTVSAILDSSYLLRLVLIGVIDPARFSAFNAVAQSLDAHLNTNQQGTIQDHRRMWTLGVIDRLVYFNFLRRLGTAAQLQQEVDAFGIIQRHSSHDARIPPPIATSVHITTF